MAISPTPINCIPNSLQSASAPALVLKVYPVLAVAALAKHARGLALWQVARAIDAKGQGRIELETLRAAAHSLGMIGYRDGRFERALANAKNAGMVREVTRRRDGARVLEIRSVLAVARALKCEHLGAFPVSISADKISKLADWRAAILAAWHEGQRSKYKPIAQSTIRTLTNIPERTQREYNKRAGVRVIQNVAVTGQRATYRGRYTEAMRAAIAQRSGVFVINDKASKHDLIAWSLPATYTTDLQRTRRGSTRKINATLRGDLASTQRGSTKEKRLFWDDKRACTKQTLRDLKPLGAGEKKDDAPRDRYYFIRKGERSGAGIWRAV